MWCYTRTLGCACAWIGSQGDDMKYSSYCALLMDVTSMMDSILMAGGEGWRWRWQR